MSGRTGIFSGSQEGGWEKKYEERHNRHLDQYYDEVISQMGQPDALLLFGPGETKLQLKDRLGRSQASSERIVAVESTDKLTHPQIVAKVKEHYGIARRATAASMRDSNDKPGALALAIPRPRPQWPPAGIA
jgi:hypothetical protein